jgi:hypothetical protein
MFMPIPREDFQGETDNSPAPWGEDPMAKDWVMPQND